MGRIVTRPIYYLRKDFDVANRHGKRLEQIVNRKPSARLRPSAKENIISVLFIFYFCDNKIDITKLHLTDIRNALGYYSVYF